ncbi:MAG: TetR/AcrR family transcriptional regulator [Thermoleophilia bacterium]
MTSTPLRSDARRNRERIVAAASELFAEHGADLCVDDIARLAGVGHATIFRRFPTKDDLVLAMFEQRMTEVAEAVEEIAATVEDPWEALATAMAAIADRQACDRGMSQLATRAVIGSPELRAARERVTAPFAGMLERAQEAGVVRDDLRPEDVLFLITAAGQSQPCTVDIPGLWRRYLAVILDGMRPGAATPLPVPAPSYAEVEAALEAAAAAEARRSSSS